MSSRRSGPPRPVRRCGHDRNVPPPAEPYDARRGVEPLRCGEQAKRPLGLADDNGEVSDRLQRRGDSDPVAVVMENLQVVVDQLPRLDEVPVHPRQLCEAEQRPTQRLGEPWVGRQSAARPQVSARTVGAVLALRDHA